jgi:ferredoxin
MNGDAAPSPASGFEPELGGALRESDCRSGFEPTEYRSGFEPELGGVVRQKGLYVDEATCIGCRYCAHVARNTFYIEPDYGRSRVIAQDGDPEDLVQEAIDTCPVDCIHWVEYDELAGLEEARKYQVLTTVGLPADRQVTYRKPPKPPKKLRKR